MFEDVLETVDDEIEELATSGGITADTRGDRSVDTLVGIARWQSAQSAALYRSWTVQRNTTVWPRTLHSPQRGKQGVLSISTKRRSIISPPVASSLSRLNTNRRRDAPVHG